MKIRTVAVNNRKAQIELTTRSGNVYPVPFSRLDPRPTAENRIREAYVDPEMAREAITYVLDSGAEGAVHIEQALEYNQDPAYLSELLVHQLTADAHLHELHAVAHHHERRHRARRTVEPELRRIREGRDVRRAHRHGGAGRGQPIVQAPGRRPHR